MHIDAVCSEGTRQCSNDTTGICGCSSVVLSLEHVLVLSVCMYCVWAAVSDIAGVACPPKASSSLVEGTYATGMLMRTSSQNSWRREVLESHLGLSSSTTSSHKKLLRSGRHLQLAKESFRQHCAEQSPREEIMDAGMCVRSAIWCNTCDHNYLVLLSTLSKRCLHGQRCIQPSKNGQGVTIINH